jgi:uncharacterized metal-binding protein YceD (DUF177 family)
MSWSRTLRLHELSRGPVEIELIPDDAERAGIALSLKIPAVKALRVQAWVRPWLDGAELSGRFEGRVEQICGVSLDPFEQDLRGDFTVNLVPSGSPQASVDGADLEIDPDAPDAPDVLAGDTIDVTAYVLEHLALELDPFPRKPGATFEFAAPEVESSPFAALKKLTEPKA